MRSYARAALAVLVAVLSGCAVVLDTAGAAEAGQADQGRAVVVHRGGHDVTVPFTAAAAGEVLAEVTASAPEVDWGVRGRESAVVSVFVDGAYQADLVVPSAAPLRREIALGRLAAGRHTLALRFAADRSAPLARRAVLADLRVTEAAPWSADYTALRFAPVLLGRDLDQNGGPFGNATTDTPLVAWHEAAPAAEPGHTLLTYSVMWSNEDGGTNTPALMARWGRTTDIEWIYQVEVDRNGDRVPGTDTFQAPSHTTTRFRGRYEADHPVLETCTPNNNVCDMGSDPMRFALSYRSVLPAGQPREYVMDTNPWTYQVSAAELRREGRLELVPDPATAEVSDQRNYLFLTVDKDTLPAGGTGSWVGLSVGVRLRGDDTLYRSDHLGTGGSPTWSIQRDIAAATTVELPEGTTADDVGQVLVLRVPTGADPGDAVRVTGVGRAFFPDGSYLPQPSFLAWHGSVTLTPASPSAVVWSSAG
jgi:hypothetical protein